MNSEPILHFVPYPLLANGFLPTRASFGLDTLFVGMFAIVFVMAISIYLVHVKRYYVAHRNIQIGLAVVLLVTIVAFEIDIRFFSDWKKLAQPSPYFESGMVYKMLAFHLLFAIPTPFIWGFVIWRAIRRFPTSLGPGDHSPEHRFWGRIAAAFMTITACTGCLFFWMAFIAS